jgi:hypothetical protein
MKATWAAKSNGRNTASGEVSRFNGVLELRARPRCSSRTFVLQGDFRASDPELLVSERPPNTLETRQIGELEFFESKSPTLKSGGIVG